MDISIKYKELLKERNFKKNSNFDYKNVKAKDKVRWICNKGHEYEASIDSRTRGTGCPYCNNKKILKGFNDLGTTNPELLEERDFSKNEKLGYSPYEISKGSSIKARWKCKKGHKRQAIVYSRTNKNANGCPYCSNQNVLKGYNDLLTTNPQIAKQWCYEKNGEITPDTINSGTNKKYRWECEKGHKWQATVSSRTKQNTGCPYCCNQKVLKGYNDLETTNPNLAKERNNKKNGNITPNMVVEGSNKKYRWECSKGHERKASIHDRSKGDNCPYCGNQKVLKGYNDLNTTHPNLVKERDYEKNDINPTDIQAGSEMKVWRICPQGHNYKAQIDLRAKRNQGCPICSKGLHISFPEKCIYYYILKIDKNIIENHKDIKKGISELDIYIPNKNIAIEYDGAKRHSKERDITKNKICEKNKIQLYRIREIGCSELNGTSIDFYVERENYEELGNIIEKIIWNIYKKHVNTNIERDKLDILKLMDLKYKNSAKKLPVEILRQRDYKRNKGLSPSGFALLSHRKVWRVCNEGHHFKASIANRKYGKGCPYCGNNKLLTGFNDLATKFPELAKEWNYEKNGNLKPNEIMSKSGKKVRWRCKNGHEWESKVYNRSNGRGCPYCIKSKNQEKSKTLKNFIKNILGKH